MDMQENTVEWGDQGIMRTPSAPIFNGYPQQKQPALAQEHFSDPFVKKAQAEGMRSRAATSSRSCSNVTAC